MPGFDDDAATLGPWTPMNLVDRVDHEGRSPSIGSAQLRARTCCPVRGSCAEVARWTPASRCPAVTGKGCRSSRKKRLRFARESLRHASGIVGIDPTSAHVHLAQQGLNGSPSRRSRPREDEDDVVARCSSVKETLAPARRSVANDNAPGSASRFDTRSSKHRDGRVHDARVRVTYSCS